MQLIPWFHPNVYMEGATALNLEEAVHLIFSSPKSTGYIFMRIVDRQVDFVNQEQVLKFGQYWVVADNGLITGIYETINDVKDVLESKEFTVGWTESGLCVTAASKAFFHEVQTGNSEELTLLLDVHHGVQIIL